MQVRTFTGRNVAEALDAVRAALGPDAMILETRTIPAADRVSPDQAVTVRAVRDEPPGAKASTPDPGSKALDARTPLREEMRDLREEVQGLRGLLFQALDMQDRRPASWPPAVVKLYAALRAQGMTALEARQWSSTVASAVPKGAGDAAAPIGSILLRLVRRDLRFAGPIARPQEGQQRIALVGATGVGKTTTLAKLAAGAALREGRRVGVLTVDTFRIAAVEQLRVYCGIMGVPMEVVREPREMPAALLRLSEADLVLVDTAGRSPRNETQMGELVALLEQIPNLETHLVLPATHAVRILAEMIKRFARFEPARLIVSKLDESEGLGGILELARRTSIPLSYGTTGQGVPDDIEVLTAERIVHSVIQGSKDRTDPSRCISWSKGIAPAVEASSGAAE